MRWLSDHQLVCYTALSAVDLVTWFDFQERSLLEIPEHLILLLFHVQKSILLRRKGALMRSRLGHVRFLFHRHAYLLEEAQPLLCFEIKDMQVVELFRNVQDASV